MNRLTQYKIKRAFVGVLLGLAIVLTVLFAALCVLFGINRFSLTLALIGDPELELEYGQAYTEPGVEPRMAGSIFFQSGFIVDTEVTVSGEVDTDTVGSYLITYTAEYRGTEAQIHRIVRVVDRTPPVITLNEIPDHFTIPGEAYSEEGFTAWDEYEGELTAKVTAVEEEGIVTYTVSDSYGNETTVCREIYYYDPVAPEITLEGETVTMLAGDSYAEPGFTAWDNCAGEITDRVEMSTDLIKYLAGTYQITYTVTDDYGNTATAQRTVIVEARKLPDTVIQGEKVIYLTFDDGPSEYTRKLLEILRENEVQATFFLTGRQCTDVIPEIVEQGHSIGIHSVTHDYASIYASIDAYFEDLLEMRGIIRDLTGVETNLIRFPGGSSNTVSKFNPGIMTTLSRAVQDCGYHYFDWNVDSDDAGKASTADEVFENVTEGILWAMDYYGYAIVLQHDTQNFSIEAVERIIQWGKDNGYTFHPLEYDSPTIHHSIAN